MDFIGQAVASSVGIAVMKVSNEMLVLSGRVSNDDYETVLAEIFYENTAEEPGSVTRLIQFTILDEEEYISMATTSIQIIPTNDRAELDLVGGTPRTLTFDEAARTPLNLFQPNDNITDFDGNSLEWLSIQLTPGVDLGDILTAEEEGTGLEMTVESYNDGATLLNISGNADLSAYETVLKSVTFLNTFPGISRAPRTFEIVLFDGETESVTYMITVNIEDFNDPPICFFGEVVSTYTAQLPPTLSLTLSPQTSIL